MNIRAKVALLGKMNRLRLYFFQDEGLLTQLSLYAEQLGFNSEDLR